MTPDAYFIAPDRTWASARAKEFQYERPQWQFLPLHTVIEKLEGVHPDEDGPIIYICGEEVFSHNARPQFHGVLQYLEARGFEIFDLAALNLDG